MCNRVCFFVFEAPKLARNLSARTITLANVPCCFLFVFPAAAVGDVMDDDDDGDDEGDDE